MTSKLKPVTLSELHDVGEEYFSKWGYVYGELKRIMSSETGSFSPSSGEEISVEDVMNTMDRLDKLVMKKRGEEDSDENNMGFYKTPIMTPTDVSAEEGHKEAQLLVEYRRDPRS